jgi:hypothetical protein
MTPVTNTVDVPATGPLWLSIANEQPTNRPQWDVPLGSQWVLLDDIAFE